VRAASRGTGRSLTLPSFPLIHSWCCCMLAPHVSIVDKAGDAREGCGIRTDYLSRLLMMRRNPKDPMSEKFIILYHGGLLWRKGVDRLLEVC
jgi:hypothetical protein